MGEYLTGKVIIKSFGNETDQTGETEGLCDFEFKLVDPITVTYGGETYKYDRLKFVLRSWESPIWFTGPNVKYAEMPVPKTMIREMYKSLQILEKKGGRLDGWCFSDELEEML